MLTQYLPIILSAIALCIAATSFVLLLAWKDSHPTVSDIREKVLTLEYEITELSDRVQHWLRRESTRAAREKKAAKQELAEIEPGTAVDTNTIKAALRAKLRK